MIAGVGDEDEPAWRAFVFQVGDTAGIKEGTGGGDIAELADIMAFIVKDDDPAVAGIGDIKQRVAIAVEADGDALRIIELAVPESLFADDPFRYSGGVELDDMILPRVDNVEVAERIGGDAERGGEQRRSSVLGNSIKGDCRKSGLLEPKKAGKRKHDRC